MNFLCKIGKHKWESTYDLMYDEYSRICSRCGEKQIGILTVKVVTYKKNKNDKSRCKNTNN